jgi:hypothetical protein
VSYARQDDSGFTAVHPDESGVPVTIYVSEIASHPTFIVDDKAGVGFRPSDKSKAYRIGEMTGDLLVDDWIRQNVGILQAYSAGEIDSYQRPKPLTLQSPAVMVGEGRPSTPFVPSHEARRGSSAFAEDDGGRVND